MRTLMTLTALALTLATTTATHADYPRYSYAPQVHRYASPNYYARHGNDHAYIRSLYYDVCRRYPTPAETADWNGRLAYYGPQRDLFVHNFMQNVGYAQAPVAQPYPVPVPAPVVPVYPAHRPGFSFDLHLGR